MRHMNIIYNRVGHCMQGGGRGVEPEGSGSHAPGQVLAGLPPLQLSAHRGGPGHAVRVQRPGGAHLCGAGLHKHNGQEWEPYSEPVRCVI